ncbi:MAG: hypothetical protein ACI8WT_004181 [Clostridium sp.]|jgi:hypothetical protein
MCSNRGIFGYIKCNAKLVNSLDIIIDIYVFRAIIKCRK